MIVVYTANGEIVQTIDNQALEFALKHNVPDGCAALDVPTTHIDFNRHYVLNGELTQRPTSPVTRTDLTLLGVPEGSTLWINGESYDAEGDVALEFPLPGTYRLRVECFPYLDWTDEVVV